LFLGRDQDLTGGQNKTTPRAGRWPQLNRPRVFRTRDSAQIVRRRTSRGVQGAAASAVRVLSAAELVDAVCHLRRCRDLLVDVGGVDVAVVAVGLENVLSVAVPVDEELDAVSSGDLLGEGNEASDLGRVTCGQALVGLIARVRRCAATDAPLVRPIAVVVSSNAGVAGSGLTVLAPESVGRLSVDESCGC
jgi:hypothetical protein